MDKKDIVATFSIVGFDPETGELGIAVQSKFLAVGSVVPWARAGVGAVATQSLANTSYGPEGLRLMEAGKDPEEVIKIVTGKDKERDLRQVGMVNASGNSATFTGKDCYDWAGGIAGENFAAQGNILVNKDTVESMAASFTSQAGKGTLAERLLVSLRAGQKAGGDKRGRQSAALLVVKEKGGYGGLNDRYIDLRVDDDPEPIKKLEQLLDIFYLYFGENRAKPVKINEELAGEIKAHLTKLGHLSGEIDSNFNDRLEEALIHFYHTENFEERDHQPGYIDDDILNYMRERVKQ